MNRSFENLEALSKIMRIFLEKETLESKLRRCLDEVLAVSWLPLRSMGAVFLTQPGTEQLTLEVERNLAKPLLKICARVPFGRCHCGMAAKEKRLVHVGHVDHRHENTFAGIEDHGHYNIPFLKEGQALGVMVLYLDAGHQCNSEEVAFLMTVGSTMAALVDKALVDRELQRAREEAVEAATAKMRFLVTMSHEIRTPLNGVLGMIQLLRRDELTHESSEIIETIQDSGEFLLRLINDVLDYSKLSTGHAVPEETPFSLQEVLTKSVRAAKVLRRQNSVRLELSMDEGLPELLLGDPTRVRQVLSNLLGNALKFTIEGSVRVHAYVATGLNIPDVLRIEVKDSGIGLTEEEAERLFNPFTQANAGTGRVFGGTGLGLVICKLIVNSMGGQIGVESVKDRGSVFWFTLPVIAPPEGSQVPDPHIHHTQSLATLGADERILVADDNSVSRLVISKMLKKLGLAHVVVENGEEALDAWRQGGFRIILMDSNMPHMGGFEATARIRAEEAGPRTAIISMTASADGDDREIALGADFDEYISKPIRLAELKRVLGSFGGADQVREQ